jgi:hypothetical protein
MITPSTITPTSPPNARQPLAGFQTCNCIECPLVESLTFAACPQWIESRQLGGPYWWGSEKPGHKWGDRHLYLLPSHQPECLGSTRYGHRSEPPISSPGKRVRYLVFSLGKAWNRAKANQPTVNDEPGCSLRRTGEHAVS